MAGATASPKRHTETYHFLRLLFARAGEAYSWATGKKMVKYTEEQIIQSIQERFPDRRIEVVDSRIRDWKIRIQDTGDPRNYGFTDPSNRKLYFGHNITADGGSFDRLEQLYRSFSRVIHHAYGTKRK